MCGWMGTLRMRGEVGGVDEGGLLEEEEDGVGGM